MTFQGSPKLSEEDFFAGNYEMDTPQGIEDGLNGDGIGISELIEDWNLGGDIKVTLYDSKNGNWYVMVKDRVWLMYKSP